MIIIGIDEVGRGPLAGPLTVGIVACEAKVFTKLKRSKLLPPLGKDSKKLKAEERKKYAKVLQEYAELGLISFYICHVSNTRIDSHGIADCIRKAIHTGIKKLNLNPNNCKVLLDGGLKAPVEFKNQKTIIKGDEKEKIIAWASILAKVSRDILMVKASKKFPQYGFEIHKGYGTVRHRNMIKIFGKSSFHRRSFCKNII